jgi:hypothetical protein
MRRSTPMPSNIENATATHPVATYGDQVLLRKIGEDLRQEFADGWLEHWFDGYIDKTVEELITKGERKRFEMAGMLAAVVTDYLIREGII